MEPLAKYEDEAEQCAVGRSVENLAAGLQGKPSRFEVRPVRVWTLREPCELSSAACVGHCVCEGVSVWSMEARVCGVSCVCSMCPDGACACLAGPVG